ncbi:unnamed protein product [Thelazia callipaeda]|uniref:Sugar phosphate transporter domain-containing protein n=1 Tax=Thelazia callipaeda TaxID=103827 RepID=A0A0N5CW77_THECL|nr:unnamed protein product [Thelazia callipaeda]
MDFNGRHKLRPFLLALIMVITGSINTISAKWADNLVVNNKRFNHPFVQSICMFLGELSCLFVFIIKRYLEIRRHQETVSEIDDSSSNILSRRSISEQIFPKLNFWVFAAPAFCDVLATSIMLIGLSAVILFTGLFSVAFLGSYLQGFRWLGMGFITVGLVIVGASNIIFDNNPLDDLNGIITGDLLIVTAQIIVAVQMVVEQKIMQEFSAPPLLVVGLEGFFGLTILALLLTPLYYLHVPSTFSTNPHHRLEDIFEALRDIQANPWIGIALLLTSISIAFFNFAGVSVTKELSATTRIVLDGIRTLFIWLISIPLFGERFIPLQLLGFALLIFGIFIYNDLYFGPFFRLNILPRISNNRLAGCCISFCGTDLYADDRAILVQNSAD